MVYFVPWFRATFGPTFHVRRLQYLFVCGRSSFFLLPVLVVLLLLMMMVMLLVLLVLPFPGKKCVRGLFSRTTTAAPLCDTQYLPRAVYGIAMYSYCFRSLCRTASTTCAPAALLLPFPVRLLLR